MRYLFKKDSDSWEWKDVLFCLFYSLINIITLILILIAVILSYIEENKPPKWL